MPVTANAFGSATLTLKATLPAESTAIYAQALHSTTSNILGLASTNVTATVLGNRGLCNSLFSINGTTAYAGPYPYNNAAIALQR